MKRLFFSLLIFLPLYLIINLYFLDKDYFLCPVEYKRGIIIRCDNRGNGFFAAQRNGNRLHEGADLYAPVGTPVLASRSGKVIAAQHSRGMGNFIIIGHTGNIITVYGHLSKVYVNKGEFVRQGEVIGRVGKTGNANLRSIQPHLHFEVKKRGIAQDPLGYLE